MQSRLSSFVEASLNTASGFVISLIAGQMVFPMFGFHPTLSENFALTCIFTVISIVRSYIWRRVFNRRLTKGARR
jgi:membrane protein implicated in regulation of membrane protease activity